MTFCKFFSLSTRLAGAVLLCVCLSGCGSSITKENYNKIKNDMSEEDVNNILGSPSETTNVAGNKVATWRDDQKAIVVTYLNGKVILRAWADAKSRSLEIGSNNETAAIKQPGGNKVADNGFGPGNGTVKLPDMGANPNQAGNTPNMPNNPNQPGFQMPNMPNNPNQPGFKPAMPNNPNQPGFKPGMPNMPNRPGLRPNMPNNPNQFPNNSPRRIDPGQTKFAPRGAVDLSRVTRANADRIKSGMSEAEVTNILGPASLRNVQGTTFVALLWSSNGGIENYLLNIHFANGKVGAVFRGKDLK